jgi:phenylacetic acid degradation operon negative regulatory protein
VYHVAAFFVAATPGLRNQKSTVALWIRRALAADPPRAKSLVVTLFGDAIAPRGGAIRLKCLIELLQLFEVNERLVRTSVFRLVKEAWLETMRNGRESSYRLTRNGCRRLELAYEKVYQRLPASWDGAWTFILIPNGRMGLPRRLKLKQELEWEGIRQLGPQLFAHPTIRADALNEILEHSGMMGKVITFTGATTDQEGMRSVCELVKTTWNLKEVTAAYRVFLREFGKLKSILTGGAGITDWEWLMLRVLLIHWFRRIVLHDPLLPSALLPETWIGDEAYQLAGEIYRVSLPGSERYLCERLGAGTAASQRTVERRFNAGAKPSESLQGARS